MNELTNDTTNTLTPFKQNAFITLLETLATTPGPSLNEEPRRRVLENYFGDHGIGFLVDDAGNLWVHIGEGPWEDSVVFDAHLDVVQEGFISNVRRDGDKLVGMGIADNLTAVTMLAFLAVDLKSKETMLKRPLKLLFSVGEEGHGNLKGVRQAVADNPSPPWLFVSFDLSFDEYSVEGLGSKRYRVQFTCPGGHSWGDYGTPGAIDQLVEFLSALKQSYLAKEDSNKGNVSFNPGTVQGGEGINSIARKSEVSFEFRSVSMEILNELDKIVKRLVATIETRDDVDVCCEITGERPAGCAVLPGRIEPLLLELLDCIGENAVSVPRSTNINIPLYAGWPSICMGLCHSGRYHSMDEYVEINSLKKGWNFLNKLTERLVLF